MHHALEIQEILLNILEYFDPRKEPSHLATLARTCRTFKEPALDLLWEELVDLSPLARCLPNASRLLIPAEEKQLKCYSFRRTLTHIEWDILRGYTHRVRSISVQDVYGLSRKSIRTLSKFSDAQQLFPNLRYLNLDYDPVTLLLFLLPLPSLVSLEVAFSSPHSFPTSLKSLASISPDLMDLSIELYPRSNIVVHNDFVCKWRNLRRVACSGLFLSAEALLHLSRMPTLLQLNFKLNDGIPGQITPPNLPLIFSRLYRLELNSRFLASVSRWLSQTRMPSITYLYTRVEECPSEQDLSSLLAALKTSSSCLTIETLLLVYRTFGSGGAQDPRTVLGFKDLQPCTAFTKLRCIQLNINKWKVDLTDGELLTLASAWPDLEHLLINEGWGWETLGGITPNGLLQLLKICRCLRRVALAIDTRGFTKFHQPLAVPGWTLPSTLFVDVLDSLIETESMLAITAFFGAITSQPRFKSWSGLTSFRSEHWFVYKSRWADVARRLAVTAEQRP